MLVARRDPVLDHGAPNGPLSPSAVHDGGHVVSPPTRSSRFIAGLQIVGTVLGIPLGLASGYSIYWSNFSPEATCGSLRANIISVLDKNADASTLRLLVRKDVASFERSCAAVYPDAVAAFRTLLAKPVPIAVAKEMTPAKPVKAAAQATSTRRPMPGPQAESEKHLAAKTAATDVESKPVRSNSNADWLAAVRHALVDQEPVVRTQAAKAPTPLTLPPAVQPIGEPLPAPPQATLTLAPPTVTNATAPEGDDDHPVPPALIPNVGRGPAR